MGLPRCSGRILSWELKWSPSKHTSKTAKRVEVSTEKHDTIFTCTDKQRPVWQDRLVSLVCRKGHVFNECAARLKPLCLLSGPYYGSAQEIYRPALPCYGLTVHYCLCVRYVLVIVKELFMNTHKAGFSPFGMVLMIEGALAVEKRSACVVLLPLAAKPAFISLNQHVKPNYLSFLRMLMQKHKGPINTHVLQKHPGNYRQSLLQSQWPNSGHIHLETHLMHISSILELYQAVHTARTDEPKKRKERKGQTWGRDYQWATQVGEDPRDDVVPSDPTVGFPVVLGSFQKLAACCLIMPQSSSQLHCIRPVSRLAKTRKKRRRRNAGMKERKTGKREEKNTSQISYLVWSQLVEVLLIGRTYPPTFLHLSWAEFIELHK